VQCGVARDQFLADGVVQRAPEGGVNPPHGRGPGRPLLGRVRLRDLVVHPDHVGFAHLAQLDLAEVRQEVQGDVATVGPAGTGTQAALPGQPLREVSPDPLVTLGMEGALAEAVEHLGQRGLRLVLRLEAALTDVSAPTVAGGHVMGVVPGPVALASQLWADHSCAIRIAGRRAGAPLEGRTLQLPFPCLRSPRVVLRLTDDSSDVVVD